MAYPDASIGGAISAHDGVPPVAGGQVSHQTQVTRPRSLGVWRGKIEQVRAAALQVSTDSRREAFNIIVTPIRSPFASAQY